MKRTKFTEIQIVSCIKQYESGVKVDQICREMGIHKATFYNWKKRHSRIDVLEFK